MISEGISWTHRLAVDQAQRRFRELLGYSGASDSGTDASYAAVCEVLLWACIADEGFDIISGAKGSPRRKALASIRKASVPGQHMIAARWARNKMTHCLARPTTATADQPRSENESASLYWLPPGQVIQLALGADEYPGGFAEYERLFAGQDVVETLRPVTAWVSEVRYDYRDPTWADKWFKARVGPDPR